MSLAKDAFEKLGEVDRQRKVERNSREKHAVAVASDTGAAKTSSQHKDAMEVMALSRWSSELREDGRVRGAVTEPLACRGLGHDQGKRNGMEALLAAIQAVGVKPELLTQVEGDSTDHAIQQRSGFIDGLVLKGKLRDGRAIVENCFRHLIVLEENAAMEAAFPGAASPLLWLYSLHEVVHSQPEFYSEVCFQV